MQQVLDRLKDYQRFCYKLPTDYRWFSLEEAEDFVYSLAEKVRKQLKKRKYSANIFGNKAAKDLLKLWLEERKSNGEVV